MTDDGVIAGWSEGAESIYGYTAADVLGRPVDCLEAEEHRGEIRRSLATGTPLSHFPTEHRRCDGEPITVEVTVAVITRGGDSRDAIHCLIRVAPPAGPGSIAFDLGERERAANVQAERAAIVESSETAIVGLTLDGRITSWNPAATRLWGAPPEDRIGQPVLPHRRDQLDRFLAEVAAGRTAGPVEGAGPPRDGREVLLSVTFSPVRDASGAIIGAASIARDITEQRALDREREQALRDLEEAQQLARIGSWSWHPDMGEAWSAQLYELYDLDPAAGPPTVDGLLAQIRPECHGRVFASGEAMLSGGDIEPFEVETVTGRVLLTRARRDPASGGYVGTVQDVTEERAAERERVRLLEARMQADSANRAKSEFLAGMSHELRTPLNAIIGFSQLLELEPLEPHQHEDVGFILRAGNHLLQLINDALDLAQVEAGRLTISPEPVAVQRAIRDALELIEPLARARGVDVTLAGSPSDGYVRADVNRLTQVLLNLLSNAIKYNHRGGSVRVEATAGDDGQLRIAISDTGPGIPSDRFEQLFAPFERLGAELTEIEGTGLGLTLSRRLMEEMDGTITVVSEVGAGSTFTIVLPMAGPSAVSATAGAHDDDGRAHPLGDGDRRRRILYIEDNRSNLALVERLLRRHPGVEMLSAVRGDLGLELARRHHPDLILLDLGLPGMSGLEVLERLRATDPDVPVIVVTANAMREQADIARARGATSVLTKPLDADTFFDAVAETLHAQQPDGSA